VRRLNGFRKQGKTNQVLVGVFVNSLKEYNAAEENIYVEIGVYAWWFDATLMGTCLIAAEADMLTHLFFR